MGHERMSCISGDLHREQDAQPKGRNYMGGMVRGRRQGGSGAQV